jgi:malate/lactate dehydrogenase
MPSSTPADVIDALTKRTQDGGTEVVEAKAGKVRNKANRPAAV